MNDEFIKNLKIAFIYGQRKVDGIEKNGIIEKIYKENDDTAHFFYIQDFLKNHFINESDLQSALLKNDVNSFFFEIQKLGHIVFAENTSHEDYKSGLFFIPNSITNKQKDSLRIFQKQLQKEDYNITELYNLSRNSEGCLIGNQMQGKSSILNSILDTELER